MAVYSTWNTTRHANKGKQAVGSLVQEYAFKENKSIIPETQKIISQKNIDKKQHA